MLKLSFPNYEFRLKKINQKRFIFDEVRKKFVELTPEEWVRQNCIRFLEKSFPLANQLAFCFFEIPSLKPFGLTFCPINYSPLPILFLYDK